ncbi:Uncharacterized protein ChrSV_2413 [Chromobacterium vaccinii]|nr:Uncharacterized protein ChrSW_2413 [Chromobacterium vaccinii]QND89870.1 Uncharacterized protein ChrSV_2413 [Chromobacterium vaccinii]
MKRYPVYCKRDSYHGRNQTRARKAQSFNQMAVEIEAYVNALLLKQIEPVQTYDYYEISRGTGYSVEQVQTVCFSIDGGHNGFTIIRHDINSWEEAQAMSQEKSKK